MVDEETFLRLYALYARLPEARCSRSDAYAVYDRLPVNRHVVDKGGAANWNECCTRGDGTTGPVEAIAAPYQGVQQAGVHVAGLHRFGLGHQLGVI